VAEIVGIYAASHTPVMLNFPELIAPQDLAEVQAGFVELGRRIAQARPQAVVVVSDDHVHNFFLDNLPAFCIGAADGYKTPIEAWLKAEKRVLPGDAALGAYLLGEALEAGFDPALSMNLTLDHGTLTPLELAGVGREIPVAPVLINCVQPPFPTMRRCLQLGRFLGEALRAYPGLERVAILATGGLSHDVGTPRMGLVNEDFDRTFLRLLAGDDDDALLAYARDRVNEAGNGAEEVRMWLVAHGAARSVGRRGFDVLYYKGLADWYAGIGLAEWCEAR
jgi:aromatic ring-opening dioxygenase catalytic subunit (LigB family)